MRKRLALFYVLIVLSANAFAQSNGSAASLWDHNGSVVYLVAQGSLREFHYKEPRPGMVEAGARPGSLLFRGKIANGEYVGTALIFDPRCGQFPYPVRGPILDNDDRIVVTGEAPRVDVKCRVQGSFMEVLEFRLRNANKTERSMAAEATTLPPLQVEERAATSPPLRAQNRAAARAPTASVVALREEQAPPWERMAAASDRASALLAAPAIPPPTPTPTLVLTAEIEGTRAASERAAAEAEAARAAEASARGAVADAEAVRLAAEERMPERREQLEAAQLENLEARSWQNLILAAISLTLALLLVAIVFLFVKLGRLQSSLPTENALAVVAMYGPHGTSRQFRSPIRKSGGGFLGESSKRASLIAG
jgi:hypothetical protein